MIGAEFGSLCRNLLEGGTAVRFQATGQCMAPEIRHGEALVVRPCAVSLLRRGEIALFRRGGELKAHRLRGWIPGRSRMIFSSDAAGAGYEIVESGDVLGEVEGVSDRHQPFFKEWVSIFRWVLGRLAHGFENLWYDASERRRIKGSKQ